MLLYNQVNVSYFKQYLNLVGASRNKIVVLEVNSFILTRDTGIATDEAIKKIATY